MKHAFLMLTACVGAISCAPKPDKPKLQAPEKVVPEPKKEARPQCYEWREQKSVATARLIINNDSVTGNLDYLFEEKDNSRGTVSGILRGDTIIADYTYSSEGTWSVIEVIFLLQGDKLLQGHGDMKENGNKIVYVNPSKVSFSTPFKGIICQ